LRRDLHHFDPGSGQHRVERLGELTGPVADQEPEPGSAFPQIHQKVPFGVLRRRRAERYPVLEFIESASQRPYAVEDQRALGGRVTLTNVRFGPLIARRIPAAGLIVLASSRHSTSVADHDM